MVVKIMVSRDLQAPWLGVAPLNDEHLMCHTTQDFKKREAIF